MKQYLEQVDLNNSNGTFSSTPDSSHDDESAPCADTISDDYNSTDNKKQYAGYTMQVIYEEVGYRNASSFTRAFKKIYNMTPSKFQKLAEEEEETNN